MEKISKGDYTFAKLLNEILCGRDEQYLWFDTHQKGQNIVEGDYGAMDDITLYRFLKTQCDGEMINWDDNIPHFETLGEQAKNTSHYISDFVIMMKSRKNDT